MLLWRNVARRSNFARKIAEKSAKNTVKLTQKAVKTFSLYIIIQQKDEKVKRSDTKISKQDKNFDFYR